MFYLWATPITAQSLASKVLPKWSPALTQAPEAKLLYTPRAVSALHPSAFYLSGETRPLIIAASGKESFRLFPTLHQVGSGALGYLVRLPVLVRVTSSLSSQTRNQKSNSPSYSTWNRKSAYKRGIYLKPGP